MSNAAHGLGVSLFYVGYILFEVPSNMLLVRGAAVAILRIMVLRGAVSSAMAVISSPAPFYVLRFLCSTGEAGFMPGVLFYLSGWVPTSRRACLTGFLMVAISLSGVIGGPVSARGVAPRGQRNRADPERPVFRPNRRARLARGARHVRRCDRLAAAAVQRAPSVRRQTAGDGCDGWYPGRPDLLLVDVCGLYQPT